MYQGVSPKAGDHHTKSAHKAQLICGISFHCKDVNSLIFSIIHRAASSFMGIPKYPKLLYDTKKSENNTKAHRPKTLQKTHYCGEVCKLL